MSKQLTSTNKLSSMFYTICSIPFQRNKSYHLQFLITFVPLYLVRIFNFCLLVTFPWKTVTTHITFTRKFTQLCTYTQKWNILYIRIYASTYSNLVFLVLYHTCTFIFAIWRLVFKRHWNLESQEIRKMQGQSLHGNIS